MRPHFQPESRAADPTEVMLQEIYERLTFTTWHFGHFHIEKYLDKFVCHFNKVRQLSEFLPADDTCNGSEQNKP